MPTRKERPQLKIDSPAYDKAVREFIIESEGSRTSSYLDTTGNRTVGVGFNMNRGKAARKEWSDAFGDNAPDFDKIWDKTDSLTPEQIDTLTDYSIKMRRGEGVMQSYKTLIMKLDAKEQAPLMAGLESIYYNCPRLLKKEGAVYQGIEIYATNGDEDGLKQALLTIKNSTPELHGRRLREAEVMNVKGWDLGHPTLKLGSTGKDVAQLQQFLKIDDDSIFGTETEKAVRRFQENTGLIPDGIVGPQTWKKIDEKTKLPLQKAEGPTNKTSQLPINSEMQLALDEFKSGGGYSPSGAVPYKLSPHAIGKA